MFLDTLSVWELGALIFIMRIFDVSFGTLRTIAVVSGRTKLSVFLGFFEVLIWITCVSQLFSRITESPFLVLAYACGFAVGNAVGIWIEQSLAMGMVVMRMLSAEYGVQLVKALTDHGGHQVTTFSGHRNDQIVTLIYLVVPRREVGRLIRQAQKIDPGLFYTIESIRQFGPDLPQPLPYATGWRAILKFK